MNKTIIALFVFGVLIISACSHSTGGNTSTSNTVNTETSVGTIGSDSNSNVQNIAIIKSADYIGKTVTVQGKVINTLKSEKYGISGYKIQNSNGITIDVSSKKQPQINTTVTVTGTLYQSRYFGIVINETE